MTTKYLAQRKQFGRGPGSLQGLQLRPAESYVWGRGRPVVGPLGRPARDDEPAATTYATMAPRHVASDIHQLTGAIGFTEEYDTPRPARPVRIWPSGRRRRTAEPASRVSRAGSDR